MIRTYKIENNTGVDYLVELTLKYPENLTDEELNFHRLHSQITRKVEAFDSENILGIIKKDPSKPWGEYTYEINVTALDQDGEPSSPQKKKV